MTDMVAILSPDRQRDAVARPLPNGIFSLPDSNAEIPVPQSNASFTDFSADASMSLPNAVSRPRQIRERVPSSSFSFTRPGLHHVREGYHTAADHHGGTTDHDPLLQPHIQERVLRNKAMVRKRHRALRNKHRPAIRKRPVRTCFMLLCLVLCVAALAMVWLIEKGPKHRKAEARMLVNSAISQMREVVCRNFDLMCQPCS